MMKKKMLFASVIVVIVCIILLLFVFAGKLAPPVWQMVQYYLVSANNSFKRKCVQMYLKENRNVQHGISFAERSERRPKKDGNGYCCSVK